MSTLKEKVVAHWLRHFNIALHKQGMEQVEDLSNVCKEVLRLEQDVQAAFRRGLRQRYLEKEDADQNP